MRVKISVVGPAGTLSWWNRLVKEYFAQCSSKDAVIHFDDFLYQYNTRLDEATLVFDCMEDALAFQLKWK